MKPEPKISTDEIICPYCDHKHRDLVDFMRFENGEEFECESCGKIFIISEIDYSVVYCTEPKKEKVDDTFIN